MSYEYMTGMGFIRPNPFAAKTAEAANSEDTTTETTPPQTSTLKDPSVIGEGLRSIGLPRKVLPQRVITAPVDNGTVVVVDDGADVVEEFTQDLQPQESWIRENWMYLLGGGLILAGVGWFIKDRI